MLRRTALWRAPAALAGGTLLVVLTVGAGPAWAVSVTAAAQHDPAAGSPANDEIITGTAQADPGQQLASVQETVAPTNAQSGITVPKCASQTVTPDGSGNYATGGCAYPYNGTYRATVVATEQGLTGRTNSSPVTADFSIYVAPAAPAGLKATPAADGMSVHLTWSANPEPDVAYEVFRNDQSQPVATTASTAVTDATTQPSTTYQYTVVAGRPGPNNSIMASPASEPAKVTTPSPPPTTTASSGGGGSTGSGGGAGGGSGGPATTVVPGGTSRSANSGKGPVVLTAPKLDLSSFASVLDKSRAAPLGVAALPGETEGPDTGYNATLPFGSRTDQSEDGANDPGALHRARTAVLGASDHGNNVRPWAAFAFGVLLTAVLVHVIWMRAEINRVGPLPPLPVEPDQPPDLPVA